MASLADRASRLKPPGAVTSRRRRGGVPLPPLILMTDRTRLADPAAAIRRLPPGTAVIFRDYEDADRKTVARGLRRLCAERRLPFLVAGDWQLAVAVGADGLHLPEGHLRHGRGTWRRVRRPGFLVTQAVHGPGAIAVAGRRGVDAVLLAPVFATGSHPGTKPLGPLRFARLVRFSPVPVYALGGVTARTVGRLAGIEMAGAAAIGAFAPAPRSQPSS